MAEVMATDMITDMDSLELNFNDINDIFDNSYESSDIFNNCFFNENQLSDDRFGLNPVNHLLPNNSNNNNNNDVNQPHNQWSNTTNQFNTIERVNHSLTDPCIGSTHCFVDPNNQYINPNQNHQIFESFSPNRCNDFYQIDDNLIRNISQINEVAFVESEGIQSLAENQTQAEELPEIPESATQLSGHLLSAQEFEQQNHSELFCSEQLDPNSQQSSIDSSLKINSFIDQNAVHMPSVPTINEIPFVDNNNNISVIKNNCLSKNHKTYSKVLKVIRVKASLPAPLPAPFAASLPPPSDDNETIAAVKGLVMLSNSCRQTVIQSKAKKAINSQMSFVDRQRLKRERNRIASKKCRQKKLETIDKLSHLKKILFEENQKCENYLKNYRQKLIELKIILLKHRLTDCRIKSIQN